MKKQDNEYTIEIIHGKRHLLKRFSRQLTSIPEPNFNGTGLALVGIMRPSETIEFFLNRVKAAAAANRMSDHEFYVCKGRQGK